MLGFEYSALKIGDIERMSCGTREREMALCIETYLCAAPGPP
jgi:hypothetical protein